MEPKFKFGSMVESQTSGKVFKVQKVEYDSVHSEFRYYFPDCDRGMYSTEDYLIQHVPSVPLTREKLIAAWRSVNNDVTWRNSREAEIIQGLLTYFGFERIK